MYFLQRLIIRSEHDNKRGTGFVNKVIRVHVSKRIISLVVERKLDSQ